MAGHHTSTLCSDHSPSRKTIVDDDEPDSDTETDESLAQISPGIMETCKLVKSSCAWNFASSSPQVLVVRTDLKMTSGKIAAQ